MLCVLIFIHEWRRDLQFKVRFEQQKIEKLFMAILFTLTEFLPEIRRKKVAEEKLLIFSF